MNNTKEHQALVHAILLKIGSRPDVRIWKCSNGLATPMGGSHPIHFGGPNGCADLSGIVSGGRRLEIEVKTGKGKQTKEQENFGKMIQRMGGVYFVAFSIEDACAKLNSALQF